MPDAVPGQPTDASGRARAPGPTAARPDAVTELVCSARGCHETAVWGLLWNNPRLHTPERRKVWLACAAHREHLEQFLGARSFLRTTVPVEDLDVVGAPEEVGGPAERGA